MCLDVAYSMHNAAVKGMALQHAHYPSLVESCCSNLLIMHGVSFLCKRMTVRGAAHFYENEIAIM